MNVNRAAFGTHKIYENVRRPDMDMGGAKPSSRCFVQRANPGQRGCFFAGGWQTRRLVGGSSTLLWCVCVFFGGTTVRKCESIVIGERGGGHGSEANVARNHRQDIETA